MPPPGPVMEPAVMVRVESTVSSPVPIVTLPEVMPRVPALVVVLIPDSGRGYLSKVFDDEWLAS